MVSGAGLACHTPEPGARVELLTESSRKKAEVRFMKVVRLAFYILVGSVASLALRVPAALIDFESIPGATPTDGMTISNQFAMSAGVSFSLEGGGYPKLAKVGLPTTAFEPNDTPLQVEKIGSFFLTDDGILAGLVAPPLIVTYSTPTAAASGVVLDIDFDEQFRIQARDASSNILQEVVIRAGDPQTGDAAVTPWSLSRPQADIHSIRFQGTRTVHGAFGLGFDNFDSTQAIKPRLSVSLLPPDGSQLDISWLSLTNVVYQLESSYSLNSNAWTNLGTQVDGNGATNHVTDTVPLDRGQRYYRLRVLN